MKLHDRSEIDRPAALVWRYIVTPELFLQWNDKVVAMEARDAFQLDQHFHTRYEMNGKQLQCWSSVTAIEKERLLELRHGNCAGKGMHRDIEVIERISLFEKGGRTVVTKNVTVRNSGVPWYFAPLIWFITRLGTPVGKDKLKELCEGGVA